MPCTVAAEGCRRWSRASQLCMESVHTSLDHHGCCQHHLLHTVCPQYSPPSSNYTSSLVARCSLPAAGIPRHLKARFNSSGPQIHPALAVALLPLTASQVTFVPTRVTLSVHAGQFLPPTAMAFVRAPSPKNEQSTQAVPCKPSGCQQTGWLASVVENKPRACQMMAVTPPRAALITQWTIQGALRNVTSLQGLPEAIAAHACARVHGLR